MREERQLRDTAKRKTLMTQSLDVTLSQIFVLFSAMFGRYKQTFMGHCLQFFMQITVNLNFTTHQGELRHGIFYMRLILDIT